jgi:hypothetical protein
MADVSNAVDAVAATAGEVLNEAIPLGPFLVVPAFPSYAFSLLLFAAVFGVIMWAVTYASARASRFTPNWRMFYDMVVDNYTESVKQLDEHIRTAKTMDGFESGGGGGGAGATSMANWLSDTLRAAQNAWITPLFVRGRTVSTVSL